MGLVAFLVVVSLIMLGVVICRLTIQEKNEDKENLENFYSILWFFERVVFRFLCICEDFYLFFFEDFYDVLYFKECIW